MDLSVLDTARRLACLRHISICVLLRLRLTTRAGESGGSLHRQKLQATVIFLDRCLLVLSCPGPRSKMNFCETKRERGEYVRPEPVLLPEVEAIGESPDAAIPLEPSPRALELDPGVLPSLVPLKISLDEEGIGGTPPGCRWRPAITGRGCG
jgi:hypothetical protein